MNGLFSWCGMVNYLSICDMIKVNELDIGNIDFELQAEKGDKCLCFILFGLQRSIHISATVSLIERGIGSKCRI